MQREFLADAKASLKQAEKDQADIQEKLNGQMAAFVQYR